MTVHNKKKLVGVQGVLQTSKDKQYSFKSNVGITSYKQKCIYQPFITVSTPTVELLAFDGTVTHVFNKKIDTNLILDKIVDEPWTLQGKSSPWING